MGDSVRKGRCKGSWALLLALTVAAGSWPASSGAAHAVPEYAGACRVAVIAGEVSYGQSFERPIGNGLKITLDPVASGWIVRVLPLRGPRGEQDYAGLATPPYHSVSPLSISTDFSFRAQDALAWNPRRFHFAADQRSFAQLQQLYDQYERNRTDVAAHRASEGKLAALAAQTPDAELTILDAHLVQGTADQAGTAAMVASHLNGSAHEVDQPADGRATALGRLNWISFRIWLNLPEGFHAAAGEHVDKRKCL